ncbi:MAG: DUF2339 domain-containing protein [Sphingomonadaceae bacterium]|nr:DUF2339 domain-containing protein [Sphingomonadaceae bacterium]
MIETLLFLALLVVGFVLWLTRADIKYLHRRIQELEGRLGAPDLPEAMQGAPPATHTVPKVRTASVVSGAPRPPAPTVPEPQPEARASRQSPFADLSFESLIGGKLPIWIGGISLVFAGFFLVRYTIEAGLFGPGARSVTATIFALAMIAMSELGGKLPKVGTSFSADPRIGQSLAGAGVAILYGTLYMAAEIYGLISVGAAFILVILTTAIAFALSLRHGPPVALMGLVGGFAAPWVAGMGASDLPTLLLYLAVFIAALFGLAVWRRWLWLLVLASGGGLAWSLAMLATANSNLGLLGGFIAITGGGALLATKRLDQNSGIWVQLARYAPLALAFVQLTLLLPKMDFSATAWLFYFALSILAIALAWRDRALLPLVAGALLLAMGPLGLAWEAVGALRTDIFMTAVITALFGGAGHIRARRSVDASTAWAIIGIAAPVLCWFTASFASTGDADRLWALLAIMAASPAAWTAWEWHRKGRDPALQPWATIAAALLLWMAAILLLDEEWAASYTALVALAVAAWARVTVGKWERRVGWVPLGSAMILTFAMSWRFTHAIGASLSGTGAFYNLLPPVGEALRTTLVPAILIGVLARRSLFASGRRTRALVLFVGGAGLVAFLWLLAKQPAHIVSPSDFIRLGFTERAIITQALFAIGWLCFAEARKRPEWSSLKFTAWILSAIALYRVIWFDLFIHNPLFDPQAVGPVPVANLLTLHLALVALWLWLMAREVPQRLVLPSKALGLGAMIVAVLATIRQTVQGNLVSGAYVGIGENYLYSAGLLVLAVSWLALGIKRKTKLLRVAGLSLLTAITLKVFLIDAAALTGILRILSFLGLGIALIGIGWAYGRLMGLGPSEAPPKEQAFS